MIPPKNNRVVYWLFNRYINRIVKKNFQSIHYTPLTISSTQSVLLIANHFSWWDGFILYHLNSLLIKKRFHIMVLEDTVKRVSFFKYVGAFSINKNTKDVVASLNYAAQLLNTPDNLVVIFPQGKLFSNFAEKIRFEKGIIHIINAVEHSNTQLLLAASFIEHLQYKKPSVNVYLKLISNKPESLDELQKAYQQHYNEARKQQINVSI